jgi:hypothetical protein
MRWVARAKSELLDSHATNRSFDSAVLNYKIFDILAALRQLRYEATTDSERRAWIEADKHFRSSHLKALKVKKGKR